MSVAESYYDRSTRTHVDGSPMFASKQDQATEHEVASMLEHAWHCEMRAFGPLSPIDYYALRDGRLVAVVEIKTRSHDAERYPTVFLNVRKWLALSLGQLGLGVPALYVVRFTDGIRWIRVDKIDAKMTNIGGCRSIVKAASDIEPVIHVPVDAMGCLR